MNNLYDLEYKKAKKRAQEIKEFLLELDSICDKMYNRLGYDGVWEALNKLEDVRINYYTQFYEYSNIIKLDRKKT